MNLHRFITTPVRLVADWHERWEGADMGLIACWECGRTTSIEKPVMAAQALAGELFVLPWKGGIDRDKIPKKNLKYGSLNYLAMWQGLRNEDLNIDTKHGTVLTCTATNVTVTFTDDQKIITKA